MATLLKKLHAFCSYLDNKTSIIYRKENSSDKIFRDKLETHFRSKTLLSRMAPFLRKLHKKCYIIPIFPKLYSISKSQQCFTGHMQILWRSLIIV
jgi:hypothetical protein